MERIIRWGALAVGILLFFGTLYYINFRLAFGTIRRLGIALPLALVFSGLWHLARTWAWAWCFPQPRTVSFARLARVRLAAEAFSYLTLRGIAGEPLKVVLLGDTVDARQATAAVALERVAYLIGTTIIVGIGSILAIVWLPVQGVWLRVFRGFAIAAGIIAFLTGHGDYRARHIPAVVARRARPPARHGARRRTGGTIRGRGRAADARARPRKPQAPRRPARRHVRGVRVHGARGVGDSARLGDRHHAERRAGGRNVLARRELRVRVHPRQSRRTRGVEPGGRGGGRRRRRRRGPRPGAAASRAVLGGDRPRDLSASHEHVARPHRNAPAGRPAAALHIALSAVRRGGQRAAVDATGRAPACRARPPSRAARRLHATDCLAASRRHTEPGRHAGGGSSADAENRGRRNHDCRDRATMARRALGSGARNAGDGHRRRHDRLDGAPRGRARPDG